MPALKEKKISSFKEFVDFIEDHRAESGGPLWYRGCGRKEYELIPKLYRHNKSSSLEDFLAIEDQLITRFRQRSIPFISRSPEDNWDWLFFMQHYGIPTRLLDWTENPFMSLFFAVTSAPYRFGKNDRQIFETDAAIWVLDPTSWNKHAVDLKSFIGKILTPDDSNLTAYKPKSDLNIMNEYPVAIYGAHNSQRIVAQRGTFVVFGKKSNPMEALFKSSKFPTDCLIKLKLNRGSLPALSKALRNHGFSDSVVFPDLDGLAREIKRDFGFEV